MRAMLARDDVVVMALRLVDRFGDHGLVASLIAVQEGEALRIDSWLMSCREFSRTAEQYMLRGLIEQGRARGALRLIGEYQPTPRNGVVAELYPALGFSPTEGACFVRELTRAVSDLATHITSA